MEQKPQGANIHNKIESGLLLGPVVDIIERSPQNIVRISAAVLAGYLAIIGGLIYITDTPDTSAKSQKNTQNTESVEK